MIILGIGFHHIKGSGCQDRTNHLSTCHPSSHLSTDPFEFAIHGSSDLDPPLHPLVSNNLEHHPSPSQP
jgi:hypothetical protein